MVKRESSKHFESPITWRQGLYGGLASFAVIMLAYFWQQALPQTKPSALRAVNSVKVWIEDGAPTGMRSTLERLAINHHTSVHFVSSQGEADFAISKQASPKSWPVAQLNAGAPTSLTTQSLVQPAKATSYFLNDQSSRFDWGKSLAEAMNKASQPKSWTLSALGDIIIGRSVYTKMRSYSDTDHPFLKVADRLKKADLTVADLENAFSDSQAFIGDTGMTFVSPLKASSGLNLAGIDAVNLANNHSYNGGAEGFEDTMTLLTSLNIGYFGGGRNDSEAHKALIREVNGTKVAMLGYSSIVGSARATDHSNGQAYIGMAPWDEFNETDVAQMEKDIRIAKQRADVVLVYYHWGTEYTHDANNDQRTVAHRAIDAGASLIIGTHPHWVQGVEWYNGHLITYSLGNFVFDQEWSEKTKQGTFLEATFVGADLASAQLVPYEIHDYNQPQESDSTKSATILRDVFAHSWWVGNSN